MQIAPRFNRYLFIAALAIAGPTTPALAAGTYCPERPGQTTPPCIIEPGRVAVETALIAWTLERSPESRADSFAVAATAVRVGLSPHLEAQAAWAPATRVRTRDLATGDVAHVTQTGDVTLALKFGPAEPVAVLAFVTVPTGGDVVGAGDWAAGVRVPIAFDLAKSVEFGLTPEIDAAVNASGNGRHIAYGGAVGLTFALTDAVQLATDLALFRDDDPGDPVTRFTAGTSLALAIGENDQLDIGSVVGLNADTPDVQLYFGIAHRF